eukprot:363375-Chlamydomonas_euryale.AAC.2
MYTVQVVQSGQRCAWCCAEGRNDVLGLARRSRPGHTCRVTAQPLRVHTCRATAETPAYTL